MRKLLLPAMALMTMAALAAAQTVEEKETSQKTYTLSATAPRRIEVENVWGMVRVTGQPGDHVELSLVQTIRANSKEKAGQARREVKLDITQENNTLRFYVDGPFRCNCDDGEFHFHSWRDRGYKVIYDFELKVPDNAFLYLRTVNDGRILVNNTAGDYDINNVNGAVELEEVSGAGRAHTVNGRISATFRKNPQAACSFRTINGALDLDFQPGLSANLRLKTFNGAIYSDFPVTYLPALAAAAERRDGKLVYRASRFTGVRVGNGGPEITLDGFNGTIRIRQRS